MDSERGAKGMKRWRALAAVSVGLLLAALAGELTVRWLLFSDSALAADLGYRLRTADAFSLGDHGEEYWYLQRRFTEKKRLSPAPGPDPVLGWNGGVIDTETRRHMEADRVRMRTPVLLYGDSFAQCVTARDDAFQGLMDQDELGKQYCLLNYGVGGYGVDQAWLMLERTLDDWTPRHPIVIFSLLVDSDLDRSLLGFRGWPKPKFEVEDGALVPPKPFELDPERWFERNFSTWRSWLLHLAAYRRGVLRPSVREALCAHYARVPEKRALNGLILQRVHEICVARGVRHCVLMFHAGPGIPMKPWTDWQEPLVRDTCARVGMQLVDTRPYFDALAAGDDAELLRYYYPEGPGGGHLTEVGNRGAFQAIVQAVTGQSVAEGCAYLADLRARGLLDPDKLPPRARVVAGRTAFMRSKPAGGCLRVGNDLAPLFETRAGYAVCVRAGNEQPTEITFPLDGSVARFAAELSCVRRPGIAGDDEPVHFTIRVDGKTVFDRELAPGSSGPAREPLELDLRGAGELVMTLEKPRGLGDRTWVALDGARFE